MGKSFLNQTEEQRGSLPACTGALLAIKSVERTKTGENAKFPGCRMYVFEFAIKAPQQVKGMTVRDWITVGTAEDPKAQRPETWERSEGGPGRLKRLLVRSGTPLSDDDEEWMEAAEGNEVVAPITVREDERGTRNGVGLYFRPSDEDAPEIGIDESGGKGRGKPIRGKGATAAAKRARGRSGAVEAEEDEAPRPAPGPRAVKVRRDEDEDENGKPVKPAVEEDEEEIEARPRAARRVVVDEDDD